MIRANKRETRTVIPVFLMYGSKIDGTNPITSGENNEYGYVHE